MKKVIIALDGQHFPKGAFEFAKYINQLDEILLAGVFLSPVDYSILLAYSGSGEGLAYMPESLLKHDDTEMINRNIQLFEEACKADGMHYRIHRDNDLKAIASLLEETRFADLLLISTELFYKNIDSTQPNYYLEEILKKTECPVVLVPENFHEPKQLILTYDGGESSVFAIKQFTYLFPEMLQKESLLLSLSESSDDELPEEYSMITELMGPHYPNLQVENLHVSNKRYFTEWLTDQPESFIVMGAFSRSLFSLLFRKSFARDVIRNIRMPIFISHK